MFLKVFDWEFRINENLWSGMFKVLSSIQFENLKCNQKVRATKSSVSSICSIYNGIIHRGYHVASWMKIILKSDCVSQINTTRFVLVICNWGYLQRDLFRKKTASKCQDPKQKRLKKRPKNGPERFQWWRRNDEYLYVQQSLDIFASGCNRHFE